MWTDFIFTLVWMLGVALYIYEINILFKGHPTDKIRMTCKAEVGEFKADHLFQKGYTYQIFMCNYHATKTYLDKILS